MASPLPLRRLVVVAGLLCAASGFATGSASAQNRYVARADSLFRSGRVFAAETLYYYAVRRQPRDPAARLALGRYLAARGALRVGAVLMEEARYFGGDPKEVAAYLAPVYMQLRDYEALAALPGSPLPYAQRARAEWLKANPPAATGPDSVTIPWAPGDSARFGRVAIVLGADTVAAAIDPTAEGLVLDTAWVGKPAVQVFKSTYESDWRNFAAVATTVGIGELALSGVPVRFEPLRASAGGRRAARLGLDVLTQFAPTFDVARRTLTLRRDGRAPPADSTAVRIPTLTLAGRLWIVRRDGLWPVAGEEARRTLLGRRWTVSPKRGEILVAAN